MIATASLPQAAASVAALLGTEPALAQASQEQDADTEIIVTARKRTESILAVPVVASTFGAEELQLFQTQDLKDIATMVPGLALGSSLLSVGTQVSLRGVGTSAFDPGVDASVALNIDGMALSQGLAYASGLFDVGQIEVLKGPQALFFGKSSPGGVISIRTADPTSEFELIARGAYEFEARERRADLIISGPVTDTLKLRVAGSVGSQDGFFTNNAVAVPALGAKNPSSRRMAPAEDYKVRATAVWDPLPQLNIRLKVNRSHDRSNYAGTSQTAFCPDGSGPVSGRQFIDADCRLDRNVPLVDLDPAAFPGIPNNGTPCIEMTQTFGTLELNYDLSPGLTLTSATGLYNIDSTSLVNAAMSSAGAGLIAATNIFHRRQLTEELRLSSDFTGPLNFTLGAFFEDGTFSDDVTIRGNTSLGAAPILQAGKKTVDIKTYSLFGQLLYKLTPELEIAGGARWTDETREQVGVNLISGDPVPVAMAVPRINAKNVAPELTLTYRPSDDLSFFAAARQGYKSSSFNVSTPPFTGENNAFGDEKVQGGEIGMKGRFDDRRMSLNVAGYYYRYSGLQVGANVQAIGGGSRQRAL